MNSKEEEEERITKMKLHSKIVLRSKIKLGMFRDHDQDDPIRLRENRRPSFVRQDLR